MLVLLLVLPVAAHVPVLSDSHNSLATAAPIEDPAVSYAIYGTLHESRRSRLLHSTMQKGDPMTFMVSTPGTGKSLPRGSSLQGPELPRRALSRRVLRCRQGTRSAVVKGVRPLNADYEPFSPMAIFPTASYEGTAPADGTYVIAVYSPEAVGPYTLASGKLESFTATEWIMIPVTMIGVRLWQEQPLWLIFGPYLVILISRSGSHSPVAWTSADEHGSLVRSGSRAPVPWIRYCHPAPDRDCPSGGNAGRPF